MLPLSLNTQPQWSGYCLMRNLKRVPNRLCSKTALKLSLSLDFKGPPVLSHNVVVNHLAREQSMFWKALILFT
jgi:hypothetical protein